MKKIGLIWLFSICIIMMQGQTVQNGKQKGDARQNLSDVITSSNSSLPGYLKGIKNASTDKMKSLECDANSLFNNPGTNTQQSYPSENQSNAIIATQFLIDGSIESLTFWGISASYDAGSYSPCTNEDPTVFDVVIYENDNDSVGAQVVSLDDLNASVTPTGEYFATVFEIMEYTINLTTPIENLRDGFISIVGQSDNDCWFLWIDTPDGSGIGYDNFSSNGWVKKPRPFTVCINGTLNACPHPVNLSAENITDLTADLLWTEQGSATEWHIELVDESNTSTTYITTIDNPHTASNLNENSFHHYSMRAICGVGDTSYWTLPTDFRTECSPFATFPHLEDFDGDWNTWCWKIIDADDDGTTWRQDNEYITPYSGSYTAYGSGNQNDYLISPAFEIEPGMELSWYAMVEEDWVVNSYEILVSTTGIALGDFTDTLGEYDCTNIAMEETVVSLESYANQTIYIAIHQTYSEMSDYGFGIDDFRVKKIPTCFKVTNLDADGLTQTSADLSWTDDNGTSAWNIEYGPAGFNLGEGTQISVTENPYTLGSLNSGTIYDFYVQADCGGGDLSEWSDVKDFSTVCGLYTDIYEDFDLEVYPPLCWNTFSAEAGGDTWGYTWTYLGDAGIGSPHGGVPGWLVTPQVTIPTDKYFSFYTTDETYDRETEMKIMITTSNDYTDTASYVLLETLDETDNTYAGEFFGFSVDVSAYEGQDVYIAFVADGKEQWSLENVHFSSCEFPRNVHTYNSTDTTIELSWDGIADSYEIEYGDYLFEPGEGTTATVTGNHFQIPNLEELTRYSYYIKAVCGSNETMVVVPHECATDREDCAPLTAYPYLADFEAEGTIADLVCMTVLSNRERNGGLDGTELIASQNYIEIDDWTPYAGLRCIGLYDTEAPEYQWLITPAFEVPQNGVQLSFAMYYTSLDNQFSKVHINIFDYADSTWTVIKTYEDADDINLYDEIEEVDLSAYANKTIKIAFVHEQGGGNEFYLDNIKVDEIQANDENDILTFSFAEQVQDATIDNVNHTVDIEVVSGTDITDLVATFTLSTNASASIGTTAQESGVTSNDFTDPVTYTIKAQNGDEQDWEVTVTNIGIEDLSSQLTKVYPNPFKDEVIIEANNGSKAELMSIDGRILHEQIVEGNGKLKINTENYSDGIYLIKIKSGSQCQTIKIIK